VKGGAKAAAAAAATPAVPAAAVASPVVAEPVVAAAADETVAAPALETLEAKITGLLTLAKEAIVALKLAKKEVEKMKKVADKAERKRANARTSPSGFAKPAKISDDLCAFLGVPAGTEMSRTDVTRHINQYVKTHNLCKPENKKVILPNAALKKLLGCKDTDVVSYFNLQRWLKGHFIRPATA
jgi:chromatin remodeling complex protein RSC6